MTVHTADATIVLEAVREIRRTTRDGDEMAKHWSRAEIAAAFEDIADQTRVILAAYGLQR